jgi:hypothetical protein
MDDHVDVRSVRRVSAESYEDGGQCHYDQKEVEVPVVGHGVLL